MESSKYPEAAFLAAMTASATHEVRNVLAIIKESAGLVNDLMEVYGARGSLDPEKVQRALERIRVQVRRGADHLTHLNRLAHTLDQDLSIVDLNEEVQQLAFLSQRFARQKGQEVEVEPGTVDRELVLNALRLHMALFAAMECCLEELPDGSTVRVGAHDEGEAAVAEFRGVGEGLDPEPASAWPGWQQLQELAGSLGAELERCVSGYGIRFLFFQGAKGVGAPSQVPEDRKRA
jgi:C4-dicarboxylate-specific signal transduction histidine kinase